MSTPHHEARQQVHEPHDRHHIHLPASFGQSAADVVVGSLGTWKFIIVQTIIVAGWVAANGWWLAHRAVDPFPFILLNLGFSLQAAYTGPLVLMAANRQASKDRARDDHEAAEIEDLYRMQVTQLEILRAVQAEQTQHTEMLGLLHKLVGSPPTS